jgi:hypothetical protein
MAAQVGPRLTRRALLAVALLGPPLAACAPAGPTQAQAPDPLIALADAARADAALAAAVIAATPDLAGRVAPLRDARTEHAAALDAEVARQARRSAPRPAPRAATGAATLDALRRVGGRQRGVGPPGRAGLGRAAGGSRRLGGGLLHDLRGAVG